MHSALGNMAKAQKWLNGMPVRMISLSYKEDKQKRGFDIQNLQKSKVFNGRNIEDIAVHSVNAGNERGGHYHKNKTEWLMPLIGRAWLVWADKLNPEVPDLKVDSFDANFKASFVAEIPPMVVHWVRNSSAEVFVMASFCTLEYDERNPDTYKVASLLRLI
jgi:dTDP-4-dehydrorhamnose 3,5-epimerase-like enzyme